MVLVRISDKPRLIQAFALDITTPSVSLEEDTDDSRKKKRHVKSVHTLKDVSLVVLPEIKIGSLDILNR